MVDKDLVLVVDDNKNNLQVLGTILSSESYQVALAKNGQEALNFVQKKKPDLILLDIMLPDIDGLEVCRKLKANNKTAEIPVIFISAVNKTEKKLKGFEVGGVDYVTKPFQTKEILARVETQLELYQTKEKLREKNEEQNMLLENIETQIWYLKDEVTYGKANSSHAQFLGLEKEELIGKSVFELFDKGAAEVCFVGNKEVFTAKKQIERKEVVKNAQGEERILKVVKTPKLDPQGNVKYVVCSAEDITEKENLITNLKESEEKFRSYVNNAPDGIFIVNRAGDYLDVNQEGVKMLGYTKEELLAMNITDVVFAEDVEESLHRFEDLVERGHFKEELRLKRKDNSLLYAILAARKIDENRFLGFVKDITEKKELEDDLRKRIKLENLIINLSREFINSDGIVESQIKKGLEKIAGFFRADCTYIYLYGENKEEIREYYRCCLGEGAKKPSFNLQKFPWTLDKLEKNKIINISSLEKMPPAAERLKERLIRDELNSTLLMPLRYSNRLIGLLGLDRKDGKIPWTKKELSSLNVLADIFTNVIERKRNQEKINNAYSELEIKNKELKTLYKDLSAEFEKASRLHQQFLPTNPPNVKGMTYDTYFQPADKLGGDFYDIFKLDGQLLFYLADVSGHGLDGSMMNIFLRENLNKYLLYEHDTDKLKPSEVITYVADKYREEEFPDDYFICLLLGVLDIDKKEITFANAGFQFPPLKVDKDGQVSALDCRGIPISAAVDKKIYLSDYKELTVSLCNGESIFLTTDGLIEERSAGERYGLARVKNILEENYRFPARLINTKIKEDFRDFTGSANGQDDLTFLTLKNNLAFIDEFETKIKSSIDKMYQAQAALSEFIAPYYSPNDLLCIGFQEIVTNAIEHGNKLEIDKEVKIKVKVTHEYIEVIISDEGEGFNWQDKLNANLNLEDDPEEIQERGRGIKIAKKAYDKLWYNEKGTRACLFKYREE